MKKSIVLAALLLWCINGFSQGTVRFVTRLNGTLITHVYQPLGGYGNFHQIGNGSDDTPTGITDWSGYGLVGATLAGRFGASTTFSTLLSADGADQPESRLSEQSQNTTFRTGGAAGNIAPITATLNNVPMDSPVATVEMVAWDNSSGLYPTWNEATVAWLDGLIAAGKSRPINVSQLGGTQNPSPLLYGLQSFNLYYEVPEPSAFALLGLSASALMVLRRVRR